MAPAMATAAEPTEVDESTITLTMSEGGEFSFEDCVGDMYGYQINLELVAWAEKKYNLNKQEVEVKKKYNITETRDWWPKRKFLAVYESWVKKKTKSVSIAFLLMSQCKRLFVYHAYNKGRVECH